MSNSPETPNELAQGLYACMSLILQQVALDQHSAREPEAVLSHFAAKLGRFLIPRSRKDARLDVTWRGRGWSIGVEWQWKWQSAQPGARPMSSQRLAELEARYLEPHTQHEAWRPNSVRWWGKPYSAVRIALSETPDNGALEIRYVGRPASNERWEWFVMYVRGLRELHHIVYGLITARVGMLRERYNTRIQSLRNARTISLHDTLTEAHALLPKLLEIGAMDLVEELLIVLVLHVFGTGWRVRPLRQHVPGNTDQGISATLLGELIARVRSHARDLRSLDPSRILRLADCLDAVIAPTGWSISKTLSTGDDMLAALAMWTHVHELSRGAKRMAEFAPEVHEAWASAKERTLPVLAGWLAKPLETRTPLGHARNWLTMWFCLELLNPKNCRILHDSESWDEVRAELAYALCETIRHHLFGERVDYFYDASALVNAVARLVEFHATSVVGIPPEYRVTGLMELIRVESGANRYSAIEHLQHVADIYIAGHFLLSLQIQRTGRAALAEQLLANAEDEDVIAKFRRAFSLAALFHDVGHILLPPDALLPEKRRLEDAVREVFQAHSDMARVHADMLTERCIEELGLSDNPGPRSVTYFATEEERLRFECYFVQQAKDGRFNHGLLGAWYLDRACVQAEQGAWRADIVMRECRKMAVRAILLHGAVTAEIDAECDPIAALLVTCNEVFEWSPARQAIRNASVLERLPRRAGPSTPTSRVDQSIQILGFGRGPDDGSQTPRFDAAITAQNGHWPVVVVTLVPPEHLDVPVYQIWLAKAQEMGRIKPCKTSGFAPALWIRSAPDPHFLHCGLTVRRALREALNRQRPVIADWCKANERFHRTNGHARPDDSGAMKPTTATEPEASGEEVRLAYLPKRLCVGDIEDELPKIVEIVDAYIAKLENERLGSIAK